MGQQQILLLILSVILIMAASVIGFSMFQSYAMQNSLDIVISDLHNFAPMAYSYRATPITEGGGGNTFLGFENYFGLLPDALKKNRIATYVIEGQVEADRIVIRAITNDSKADSNMDRWILIKGDGTIEILSQFNTSRQ